MPSRKIFINLAVRDLKRSMEFFRQLGFEFNKQFTDEKAACMVFSEEGFAMLLTEPFFKGFTPKQICDTRTQTEALVAISCGSRAEVDQMMAAVIAAGGKAVNPPVDHGFMYGASFYDLDGHHWEPMWMDPSAVQPQ